MQNKLNRDKERKPIIGITHGDFNGIGYEVIIKALNDKRLREFFTPVIYGLSKILFFHRKLFKLNDFNFKVINDAKQVFANQVNIINISNDEVRIEHGRSTSIAGKYAYKALEFAVNDLKSKKIDVLVTAPINKANIQSDSFDFPGHTEFFTQRFNCQSSLMLMVSDTLRIGTITGHIPLSQVPSKLSELLILEKIDIMHYSLITDFGINKPKIAVLGLNPHAGDNGLIGDEDDKIINPAIIKAKKQGKLVYGPFPADGFFGAGEYAKFDGVLAMYHDQGMVPFKTLAFKGGVNYTAGLPIIRTSPAHGTAYDKAGKNQASESSMRQAIYLALDIYKARIAYDDMNKDPLPKGMINDYVNGKHQSAPEELKDVED